MRAEDSNLSLVIVKERVRSIFVNAVVEQVADFIPDAKAWHDLLMISYLRTDVGNYKDMFKKSFEAWMDRDDKESSVAYEAIWTDHMQHLRRTWGARTHNFCRLIDSVF